MITNRFYALLLVSPLVAVVVLGAAVSGFDLAFMKFFTGVAGGTMGVIALFSVPFIRSVNAWRAAPIGALARAVGGRVVETVGADVHVRVGEGDEVTVAFFVETQEVAGGADDGIPAVPWTCIGKLRPRVRGGRPAPSNVEVRLLPGGGREVRWLNRWVDEYRRRRPADPVSGPAARAAEAALRALSPEEECRLRYEGDVVAFAVRGHVKDTEKLAALFREARPHVASL